MPCHVYYWKPEESKKSSFGHISMETDNRVYISFWPKDEMKNAISATVGCDGVWRESLDDERAQYKNPDITVTVFDMDSASIERWFCDYQSKNKRWNLLTHSCSNVVYYALCAGSDAFSKFSKTGPTTPKAVYEALEAYNGAAKAGIVMGKCKIK